MNHSLLNKSTKTILILFYEKESNIFETYPNVDKEISGEGTAIYSLT